MADATHRIKNLSIALEALSRVPGSLMLSNNIQKLLEMEIFIYHKEKEKEIQWPWHGRPAPTTPNPEDECPF